MIPRPAFARALDVALPVALSGATVWSVLGHGVPALRHDWLLPVDREALGTVLRSFFEPWIQSGIGNPQPYPTFYLLGFALWPLHRIVNDTWWLLAAIIGVSTFVAAHGSALIVRRLDGSPIAAVTAALVAALNPWVYNEYVAGHIFMVFAYASLLLLVAETLRAPPRDVALVLLGALAVTQIEFFLFAVIPIVAWSFHRRRRMLVVAVTTAALPIALGITLHYGTIRATPYALVWQQANSVAPLQAILLRGYAFPYDAAFDAVLPASAFLFVLALSGAGRALRNSAAKTIVAFALLALLLASGTKGPIAPLYTALVLHVPESGVFRELYDLIAIVAIGYVILIAHGASENTLRGALGAAASLALLVPWTVAPPSQFFVDAAQLPRAPAPKLPNARTALLPAFQPLQFEGRGSGYDPDLNVPSSRARPLNDFYPTYPVDRALAFVEQDGDVREVAALGAVRLIVRPYLRSDLGVLAYQRAGPQVQSHRAGASRIIAGTPMLSWLPGRPVVASVADSPAEDAVFFADASEAPAGHTKPALIRSLEPDRATIDPATAWVDGRLAVAAQPHFGNAFGGVYTTGRRPFEIPAARAVLAQAHGTLRDERGRTVARDTRGFHWFALPSDAHSLVCEGRCAIALSGDAPFGLPEHGATAGGTPVPFVEFAPWLARAELPSAATGEATLRYLVRYERSWTAVCGMHAVVPHVRLATSLNGWLLPGGGSCEGTIWIVNVAAAVQLALEAVAALALILLVVRALRPS